MLKIPKTCIFCSGKVFSTPALISKFLAKRMFGWEAIVIEPNKFSDFLPGVSYPCCNTLFCDRCKSIFMDIRPSFDLVKKYYNGYQSEEFHKDRELIESSYIERRKLMNPDDFAGYCSYLPQIEYFINLSIKGPFNKIIDIGGGDGSGTPFFNQCKELHIFDINVLNNNKLSENIVFHSTLPNQEMSQGFDLVVCRNVLEHLSDPNKYLKEITKILKIGTPIYVEVPFENIMRNGFDSNNLKIWTEHINFFTSDALKYMFQRNSIDIICYDILKTGRKMAGHDHDFQVIRFLGKTALN